MGGSDSGTAPTAQPGSTAIVAIIEGDGHRGSSCRGRPRAGEQRSQVAQQERIGFADPARSRSRCGPLKRCAAGWPSRNATRSSSSSAGRRLTAGHAFQVELKITQRRDHPPVLWAAAFQETVGDLIAQSHRKSASAAGWGIWAWNAADTPGLRWW